jgi:hypothetical protein
VASDARGKGVLTIPPAAGRYRFSCDLMVSYYRYEISAAILKTDQDFDPRKIKGLPEPHPKRRGAGQLRDAAGRSAVVEEGDVVVDSGQATFVFPPHRSRVQTRKKPCRNICTSKALQVPPDGLEPSTL